MKTINSNSTSYLLPEEPQGKNFCLLHCRICQGEKCTSPSFSVTIPIRHTQHNALEQEVLMSI